MPHDVFYFRLVGGTLDFETGENEEPNRFGDSPNDTGWFTSVWHYAGSISIAGASIPDNEVASSMHETNNPNSVSVTITTT